ncbi:MAG: VanW family protein [Lachnospiraceae bacterium]|nr:VanW family protein [Lachnospiraceae bacterium]
MEGLVFIMLKKFLKIFLITIVVLLIAAIGVFGYYYHKISTIANAKVICQGVTVEGIDVGGLTKQEAYDKVEGELSSLSDKKITLTYEDHSDTLPLSDIGMKVTGVDEAVEEAYNLGKKGTTWQRYQAINNGVGEGKDFTIEKKISKDLMAEYLDKNSDSLVRTAKNATMTRKDGQFIVTEGVRGMEIPAEANTKAINDYLSTKWDGNDFSFELIADEADPEYTKEDLEKVCDVLGTYSTDFSTSSYNRRINISNAASKINDHLIYPGEEFGLLELMVPFTTDNGYQVAQAYSAGEVVDSVGGGVCQVATTLYNAVLLAELEVVERYNHGMVVSYVPLSQDAAISEAGHQDFKFRNNLENPVYVEAYTAGTTVTFTIYGVEDRPKDRKVEYVSENVQTINPGKDIETKDPSMAEGKIMVTQAAHIGYRAKLWKVVYENGKEVSRDVINTSYYAPSARRVNVGTKKSAKAQDNTAKTDNNKNKNNKTKSTEAPATPTEAPPQDDPVDDNPGAAEE